MSGASVKRRVAVTSQPEDEARGKVAFACTGTPWGETLARKVAELAQFSGQRASENDSLKMALTTSLTKYGML